jgi:hypothetical protein
MADLTNINFSKYKRFFTFGCSFTSYSWPTWADVLASEMPNAEFYNFGHCGGGNSMISNRIVEANCRYKFTDTDLVIPMWTTFCREDRYCHGHWMSTGNMFSQGEFDEEFVRKYCDPIGYLIRDLAIITITNTYLKSLPSDYFTLNSVPYNYQIIEVGLPHPTLDNILEVYKDTIGLSPPALVDLELGGYFKHGHIYTRADTGEEYNDYHPHTLNYYGYLKKLGLPLTSTSLEYTVQSMKLLQSAKTEEQMIVLFNTMLNDRNQKLKSLF